MNAELQLETEKLTHCWDQHEPTWLRSYLVAGVEDPRVNLQSILSRHFLIRALAQDRWEILISHEYRFAAAVPWLLAPDLGTEDEETRAVILHALRKHSDNAEGLEIPNYVLQTFAGLPAQTSELVVPNYIEEFLVSESLDNARTPAEKLLNTFAGLWNSALEVQSPAEKPKSDNPVNTPHSALSLVEPACGSANDYRFLHSFGLGRFFHYSGFDLCQKNIENARALFPGVQFAQGNVFEIAAPAKAFDLCVVQDLFEHLSLCGLEKAVEEVCRVTRRGICAGFFQMDQIGEHVVRPRDEYYWNLLSLSRMRELFLRHGFAGQAIHIDTFLSQRTGCRHTHNPNAYTLMLEAGEP